METCQMMFTRNKLPNGSIRSIRTFAIPRPAIDNSLQSPMQPTRLSSLANGQLHRYAAGPLREPSDHDGRHVERSASAQRSLRAVVPRGGSRRARVAIVVQRHGPCATEWRHRLLMKRNNIPRMQKFPDTHLTWDADERQMD